MSTFGVLEAARTGLNASQLGLNITAQNIANANTDGYSRQAINQSALSADTGSYRYSNPAAKIGRGVSVDSVYQIRNSFLDMRYREANSIFNLYDGMETQLKQIEDQFTEISDSTASTNKLTGLSGIIDNIITSLQTAETNPTSSSVATAVKTQVDYLASTIRRDYNFLEDTLDSEIKELEIYVSGGIGGTGDSSAGSNTSGIDGIIENIQNLNKEIAAYEISGKKANELRDQRNLLLDKLSSYIDIETAEVNSGMITIQLKSDSDAKNNVYIIDESNNANEFKVGKDESGNTVLKWDKMLTYDGKSVSTDLTGTVANVEAGTVKAYLNVINGDGSGAGEYGNVGIPYLIQKLNNFALAFMNIMNNTDNAVLNAADTEGFKFLKCDMDNPAATIDLTDDWKKDTDYFIENYKRTDYSTYYQAYVDALSKTEGSESMKLYTGTFSAFADSFTSDIASAVSIVAEKADAAAITANNLDDERQSIFSVSLNDEGTNLLRYQQAYNASARVITAIDEMLDKLINGTGTVGR